MRNFPILAHEIFIDSVEIFRRMTDICGMTTGARITKVFLLTLAKHKQTKFLIDGKFSSEFELFQITFF